MVFYNLGHVKGEKGEDSPITDIDSELSTSSTNPVQNRIITMAVNSKLGSGDIVDNLTTDNANKVLSARQGKILNDLIGSAIEYINR